MNVLVIDARRNGLGVVRALKAAHLGLTVHLAAPAEAAPARFSRHVTHFWRVPSPTDPARWLTAMLDLGRRLTDRDGLPILLPVNDIYVLLAARHWDELGRRYRPAFETRPEVLDRCLSKDRCYGLAEGYGVTVPKWAGSAAAYVASGGAWPAIVKPALRNAPEFSADPPFRARMCESSAALESACAELVRVGARPVVQEFIAGGDDALVTAGIAALDGRVLATFTGRKLRQFPPLVGEASYAESMAAPEAAAGAARMLAAIGFTGLAQVEFKRRAGVDHLLEINPRSWSWIGLTAASGVNLPGALFRAIRGLPIEPTHERSGVRWMYAGQDLRYHGRRGGPLGWIRWLWEAITAGAHAHWRWDDPLPAVAFIWSVVFKPGRTR